VSTPETGFQTFADLELCRRHVGTRTKIRNSHDGLVNDKWPVTCSCRKCGRIPKDGHHRSTSEGEGACSKTCAGRSHLPLRGKLGWMTPRSGQKKTGKRNAFFGAPVPKQEPQFFCLGPDEPQLARLPGSRPIRPRILCAECSALSVPLDYCELAAGGKRAASGEAEPA
jgi:hypothetical protein